MSSRRSVALAEPYACSSATWRTPCTDRREAFIDALFLCYSALTVTGLSTINLSTLTVFQQVILLVLMILGNVVSVCSRGLLHSHSHCAVAQQTLVAWVMVLVRLRYFRQYITAEQRKKTLRQTFGSRMLALLPTRPSTSRNRDVPNGKESEIHASDGIGAALAGGATTGIGLGIALGAEHIPSSPAMERPALIPEESSHIRIHVESPDPLEDHHHSAHTVVDRSTTPTEGVIADVHSFTSSPRSGAIPLSPVSVNFRLSGEHFPPTATPHNAVRRRGTHCLSQPSALLPNLLPFSRRGPCSSTPHYFSPSKRIRAARWKARTRPTRERSRTRRIPGAFRTHPSCGA